MLQATVGAGLPVMSTLKSLIETGDTISSIEGILSGTLSYIFNTWQPGQPFSEVVAAAQQQGYTEPDPRDDLSGDLTPGDGGAAGHATAQQLTHLWQYSCTSSFSGSDSGHTVGRFAMGLLRHATCIV